MTTFGDRVYELGGTPVGMGMGDVPIFGKIWYVDGTNGSDDYPGLKPGEAKATIQAAITAQIASYTTASNRLGDVIYVLPGSYAETITCSSLTKVQLIGTSCGGEVKAVVIYSATGHALAVGADATATASLVNSGIRNITFYTPSAGTVAKAALVVSTIQMSIIDNCKFLGNYQAGSGSITTVGLQLGCHTATVYSWHEFGTISNCEFGTSGARAKEVDTAIRVGAATGVTPASTGFKSMKIINNLICAEHYGINMGTGATSCGGTLIAGNVIHSHQGGGGPTIGIYSQAATTDQLCMIQDNRINAQGNCIAGFGAGNTMGNIVSLNQATPTQEYPASS